MSLGEGPSSSVSGFGKAQCNKRHPKDRRQICGVCFLLRRFVAVIVIDISCTLPLD